MPAFLPFKDIVADDLAGILTRFDKPEIDRIDTVQAGCDIGKGRADAIAKHRISRPFFGARAPGDALGDHGWFAEDAAGIEGERARDGKARLP